MSFVKINCVLYFHTNFTITILVLETNAHLMDLNIEHGRDEKKRGIIPNDEIIHILEICGDIAWWSYDVRNDKIYYSKTISDLLGYKPVELPQKAKEIKSFIHPDDFIKFMLIFDRSILEIKTGLTDINPIRIRHKNHKYKWFSVRFMIQNVTEKPQLHISGIIQKSETQTDDIHILKQNEIWLNTFLQNISDCILLLDLKGYVTYISPSCEYITGFHPSDFYSHFSKYVHPEDIDKLIKAMNFCIEKKHEIVKSEYRHLHKNGNYVYLEAIGQCHIQDNKIDGVIVSVRDITSRIKIEQKLREKNRFLNTLLSNLPGMVYRCKNDHNWTMEFVSKGAYELTEYTHDELINNKLISFNSIINKEHRSRIWNKWQDELERHGTFRDEYTITTASGAIKWVWEQGSGVWDEKDNLIALEGFITDITEKKEDEEKLKEAISTKDRFFSIISHDLKSPFNSIIGFSDLLLNSNELFDEDEQKALLTNLHDTAQNTHKMLENLLSWSKVQLNRTNVTPEIIHPKEILSELIKQLQPQAKSKQINISYDIPENLIINADYDILTTVLRNLISNAIKFTNSEGNVSIRFEKNENYIIFSVKDDGIGISEKDLQNLFRIDEKVLYTGTNGEKGTGLGLILCKELIELHNGKIWVESKLNKGSIFYFTIPQQQIVRR